MPSLLQPWPPLLLRQGEGAKSRGRKARRSRGSTPRKPGAPPLCTPPCLPRRRGEISGSHLQRQSGLIQVDPTCKKGGAWVDSAVRCDASPSRSRGLREPARPPLAYGGRIKVNQGSARLRWRQASSSAFPKHPPSACGAGAQQKRSSLIQVDPTLHRLPATTLKETRTTRRSRVFRLCGLRGFALKSTVTSALRLQRQSDLIQAHPAWSGIALPARRFKPDQGNSR